MLLSTRDWPGTLMFMTRNSAEPRAHEENPDVWLVATMFAPRDDRCPLSGLLVAADEQLIAPLLGRDTSSEQLHFACHDDLALWKTKEAYFFKKQTLAKWHEVCAQNGINAAVCPLTFGSGYYAQAVYADASLDWATLVGAHNAWRYCVRPPLEWLRHSCVFADYDDEQFLFARSLCMLTHDQPTDEEERQWREKHICTVRYAFHSEDVRRYADGVWASMLQLPRNAKSVLENPLRNVDAPDAPPLDGKTKRLAVLDISEKLPFGKTEGIALSGRVIQCEAAYSVRTHPVLVQKLMRLGGGGSAAHYLCAQDYVMVLTAHNARTDKPQWFYDPQFFGRPEAPEERPLGLVPLEGGDATATLWVVEDSHRGDSEITRRIIEAFGSDLFPKGKRATRSVELPYPTRIKHRHGDLSGATVTMQRQISDFVRSHVDKWSESPLRTEGLQCTWDIAAKEATSDSPAVAARQLTLVFKRYSAQPGEALLYSNRLLTMVIDTVAADVVATGVQVALISPHSTLWKIDRSSISATTPESSDGELDAAVRYTQLRGLAGLHNVYPSVRQRCAYDHAFLSRLLSYFNGTVPLMHSIPAARIRFNTQRRKKEAALLPADSAPYSKWVDADGLMTTESVAQQEQNPLFAMPYVAPRLSLLGCVLLGLDEWPAEPRYHEKDVAVAAAGDDDDDDVPLRPKRLIRPFNPESPVPPQLFTVGNGLAIRPSQIAGAGNGLFATRRFRAREAITAYSGQLLRSSDADRIKRDNPAAASHMRALFARRYTLDGRKLPDGTLIERPTEQLRDRGGGAFANDPHGTELEANAEFDHWDTPANRAKLDSGAFDELDPEQRVIVLVATRDINPDEEVLISYGDDYWAKPMETDEELTQLMP